MPCIQNMAALSYSYLPQLLHHPSPAKNIPGFGFFVEIHLLESWGWSGGAKVLGKLPVPGRPTILITVGQGPTALAVGAGGGCLDIFTLIYPSLLFLPLFGRRPDID